MDTGKNRKLVFSAPLQPLSPTVLTIFGATGDLMATYLLPALHNMDMEGLLPENFKLVCVGRREFSAREFLDFVVSKSEHLKKLSTPKHRKHFLRHLTYYRADFEDPKSFAQLSQLLSDSDAAGHACFNRLYYIASNPRYFASIATMLEQSGLLNSCLAHNRDTRILVEKPFGSNLKSAKLLNKLLLKYFTEEQIYRIDHYLGKETVQNLIVARFANGLFEPLWNKDHVSHIEISALELDTVKTRGEFYNQTGALKDFVQNHLLQLLALVTMNEPKNLTAEHIRREKLNILKALKPFGSRELKSQITLGQYKGYVRDIGKVSRTETYAALKVFIGNKRWSGVPIYLRTGKALPRKVAEISVHFKEPVRCLFQGCGANTLTFQIQPEESVRLSINNKIPGFGIRLHQAHLDFSFKNFTAQIPAAYERLLLDFMQGDQRLFISSAETEAAWKFMDSVTENALFNKLPLHTYNPGSRGPKEAEDLINKDMKEWWTK